MVFTSFEFLIFFTIVTSLYFLLPNPARPALLLGASCYFYMAFIPKYILVLFALILVDYVAGRLIENSVGKKRKFYLVCSIIANLSFLFVFKYLDFATDNLNALLRQLHWDYSIQYLHIILPLGLSFHTFQSMSYTIEVYRGHQRAEKNIIFYSLFVLFYPQLVAGPIERGPHMIPQLRRLADPNHSREFQFDYDRVVSGLRLMLLGFFKKVVLADNLALIVDPVYAAPQEYSGISTWLATVSFAFQIFFDFSAYTDIARGAARVLGIELVENFRRPYFAASIQDFWQRWHKSLSTWFRDYLYIPLGGNRVSKWRWFMNLWIVFLLCGFWHGAQWTFLIWGALHGFYYFLTYALTSPARWVAERTFLSRFPGLRRAILVMFTFSLVSWAWVMFRAESVSQALTIWANIAGIPGEIFQYGVLATGDGVPFISLEALSLGWLIRPSDRLSLMPVYVSVLTISYLVMSYRMRKQDGGLIFGSWRTVHRWGSYWFALVCLLLLGRFGVTQFIYFQF